MHLIFLTSTVTCPSAVSASSLSFKFTAPVSILTLSSLFAEQVVTPSCHCSLTLSLTSMTGTVIWDLSVFCLKPWGLIQAYIPCNCPKSIWETPTLFGIPTVHIFCLQQFSNFMCFNRSCYTMGLKSSGRQRHCDSLLNLLCWHSKPSKVLLSKKPGQV